MTPAELLPEVYQELRRLAADKLQTEQAGHTLNATALVHEAFLKLGGERSFATRSDYFYAAALAMRRILVDHARARNAQKRGSGKRLPIEVEHLTGPPKSEDVLALDDALTQLAVENPRIAELVQLKHFGGLTLAESAEVLGISERSADSWWAFARAWLAIELRK